VHPREICIDRIAEPVHRLSAVLSRQHVCGARMYFLCPRQAVHGRQGVRVQARVDGSTWNRSVLDVCAWHIQDGARICCVSRVRHGQEHIGNRGDLDRVLRMQPGKHGCKRRQSDVYPVFAGVFQKRLRASHLHHMYTRHVFYKRWRSSVYRVQYRQDHIIACIPERRALLMSGRYYGCKRCSRLRAMQPRETQSCARIG